MSDAALPRHGYFRAVAIDFDGTLTETGHLDPGVITAIGDARVAGIEIVIATGRILAELFDAEPRIHDVVGTVVGENGCVLSRDGVVRRLVRPVDEQLDALLRERGVSFRRGDVLIACAAQDERHALDAVRALGEECQLVRNRSELMILPPGVSKGTGVEAALADLGLSVHSTIGVGDAENDHSLLDACELGVAVSNAVESLRHRADIVLEEPDGAGVSAFLASGVVRGRSARPPLHWNVDIGTTSEGATVTIPASQINVLIAGGSGSGKSFCAGQIAEQLIRLGYSMLIIDPEGDHRGLGSLPGVTMIGVDDVTITPASLMQLLGHPGTSVVVDLSGMTPGDRDEFLDAMPAEIAAQRSRSGLPHWVMSDEAQQTLGDTAVRLNAFDTSVKGHLLATWRPEELRPDVLASIDVALVLSGDGDGDGDGDLSGAIEIAAAVGSVSQYDVAAALRDRARDVVMTARDRAGVVARFALSARSTHHLRHEHKYERVGVPAAARFHLWDPPDDLRHAWAANLDDLAAELAISPDAVFVHHGSRGDFSRWIREVLKDDRLARSISLIEDGIHAEAPLDDVRIARSALLRELRLRR